MKATLPNPAPLPPAGPASAVATGDEQAMNEKLEQYADRHFRRCYGRSLEELCAPIAEEPPAGPSLAGSELHRAIGEARRADDPSLPLGPWAFELKQADWVAVGRQAAEGLALRAKDLQLCAWLLEAELHRHGLDGLAPTLHLIDALCDRYWPHLHPQPEEGDLEHRGNLFLWLNEKLLPVLRQVPLTGDGAFGPLSWGDWERAIRNDQLRSVHSGNEREKVEGPGSSDFAAALAGTATEALLTRLQGLNAGLAALDGLERTLERVWGEDAASLGALRGLLGQVQALLAGEVRKRGVAPGNWLGRDERPADVAEAAAESEMAEERPAAAAARAGVIASRADAYARLAEAADYLARVEPHSPAPYLVRRAVEWGMMDTRELYQELFLSRNGQLNIFELIGAELGEAQPA